MGSAVSITANILGVNDDFSYIRCVTPKTIAISGDARIMGEWFLEPYECILGICYKKFAEAQTDFAIQAVEVLWNGITYFLNGTLTEWVNDINECCGDTPTLTPILIPTFVPDGCICADDDGNYIYNVKLPLVVSPQTFKVSLFNTGAAGSSSPSTALASYAAALSYANTNWSAYGTWALTGTDGNFLTLTSTTFACIGLQVALDELDFCIDPDFPLTFDTVTRDDGNGGTATYTVENGPITVANNVALKQAIAVYFTDGTLTTAVAGMVQYTGTGRPLLLKNGVTTVGTWVNAECS